MAIQNPTREEALAQLTAIASDETATENERKLSSIILAMKKEIDRLGQKANDQDTLNRNRAALMSR